MDKILRVEISLLDIESILTLIEFNVSKEIICSKNLETGGYIYTQIN